jgi:hypothetical protein
VSHVGKDSRWPDECDVVKCENPTLRPHHHHVIRGSLQTNVCTCSDLEQPGTRPKETGGKSWSGQSRYEQS